MILLTAFHQDFERCDSFFQRRLRIASIKRQWTSLNLREIGTYNVLISTPEITTKE